MGFGIGKTSIIKRVKIGKSSEHSAFRYRIQLVDESLIAEAAEFMDEYFIANSNLENSYDSVDDEEMIDKNYSFWRVPLSEGISLAAFLEDDEDDESRMICCSVLGVEKKEEKPVVSKPEKPSKRVEQILQTQEDLIGKADVFSLFNCDAYVTGHGMATAPKFQRRGIGEEMLRARSQICRLTNIPVSAAVFTGEASQKLAKKCGYETLAELDLTTYRIDGKLIYPNPDWPVIKWMAARYF
ncbi:unnamed protein product [Bemisia tabaci]|uniref:N-acetyltransferase domain-containing protein n=2 Tax=Bemisia tabaci TaxID=7038 RepID=A0A9P0F8H2_BEMTA|nr:unnamed protein product [Bemisia tabaci]